MIHIERNRFWRALATMLVMIIVCCYFGDKYVHPYTPADVSESEIIYVGKASNMMERNYDVTISDSIPSDAKYVMVDHGMAFAGMKNYERIAIYQTPLVFVTKNMMLPLDMKTSFNEILSVVATDSPKWSQLGVTDASLGSILIYIPYDTGFISAAILNQTDKETHKSIWHGNYLKSAFDEGNLTLTYEANLENLHGYDVVNIDMNGHALVFDLYKKVGTDNENVNFPHMYEVTNEDIDDITVIQDIAENSGSSAYNNPWTALLITIGIFGALLWLPFAFAFSFIV